MKLCYTVGMNRKSVTGAQPPYRKKFRLHAP